MLIGSNPLYCITHIYLFTPAATTTTTFVNSVNKQLLFSLSLTKPFTCYLLQLFVLITSLSKQFSSRKVDRYKKTNLFVQSSGKGLSPTFICYHRCRGWICNIIISVERYKFAIKMGHMLNFTPCLLIFLPFPFSLWHRHNFKCTGAAADNALHHEARRRTILWIFHICRRAINQTLSHTHDDIIIHIE